MSKILLGRQGELAAAGFLKRKGFVILARNFRCRLGEIDIVARDKEEYVFIEVRSASQKHLFMEPSESISYSKIKRLKALALIWLNKEDITEADMRFDVITVIFRGGFIRGRPEINHIPGAF